MPTYQQKKEDGNEEKKTRKTHIDTAAIEWQCKQRIGFRTTELERNEQLRRHKRIIFVTFTTLILHMQPLITCATSGNSHFQMDFQLMHKLYTQNV